MPFLRCPTANQPEGLGTHLSQNTLVPPGGSAQCRQGEGGLEQPVQPCGPDEPDDLAAESIVELKTSFNTVEPIRREFQW